ncbi:MAG: DEAD/DEAH box helicase [Treponema sp.]|jgi:ATP-dependent RNA helicase RhlB|nr:DEAD/DEAH box helicase [Treponema sp.]
MEFSELNLHQDLKRGIEEAGYISCMPVQEQVLKYAFEGRDLYVQSQTGTGKTAAFLVVIFQRLLTEEPLRGKKAIIMVPTRELAVQVEEEAKTLGKYLPFKIGSFYGGVGYAQQQQLLRENVQILVGTPGRVLDLNKSGRMNLMDLAFLILDEADRMFDMGFYPDLRKLIKVVPPVDRRQTMLFSATLNAWVKNLAWEYTKSPFEIEIAPETVTVDEVEQVLYHVPSGEKMRVLLGILQQEKPESAIIFCNTKRYTEIVAKRLRMNGIEAEFIIGDLPQKQRLRIIDDVKAGKTRFLVATDVAARGLDIEGLALVVNYDLPVEAENYVHRIGRTARAGKTGKAITLASEQDVYELPGIEKYIGKKIPALISGKDLQGEDKSEGQRIRTEFAGFGRDDRDRGRGRQDRGPIRRERHGERERSPRGRGENRRPQREEKRPAGQESEDLAGLSFEERMARYRQKYAGKAGGQGSGGAQAASPRGSPANETPRRGKKRGRQQPQSRSEADTPRRNRPQGRSETEAKAPKKRRSGGKAEDRTSSKTAVREEVKTSAPGKKVKKGFFEALLGLLKK